MRMNGHNRLFLTCWAYATLVSFLFWTLAAFIPPTAQAAEPTLGLATGSKDAQVATDGQRWTTLSSSSNPLYEGTLLRTGKGAASVLLKDGTQIELQSHTIVGLAGSRTAPVVKVAVGQILFRVPSSSRATFATPSVRYQTDNGMAGERPAVLKAKSSGLSTADSVGTIVVNPGGGSRLNLQQGEMLAKSVGDPGLHIVKAGQSVYIPHVGAPDHDFGVMLAQALPGDAGPAATDDADTEVVGAPGTGTEAGGIGSGTAAGLGVGLAVIGLGVGLGVSESGKASPSTPSE